MTSDDLRRLIAPHANEIGGPLSALRTIQQQRGWVDDDAIDAVADVFNLGRAEVRGLVGFYSDFRTSPPATHVLKICQAEAC
jgi:formate dehydrogenase subunit gamma